MTGKDLLTGLGGIEAKWIAEAETADLTGEQERVLRLHPARVPRRRPLLVAAIIVLTLLLVGCAAVYALSMRDMKVADQAATRPVIADDGMNILGYTDTTEQVLTLAGLKGSPGFQAAQEWYTFKREYDPDHQIQMELAQNKQIPEFPAEYGAYSLYSQEMKDKLDEILAKYDLKPAGAWLAFRTLDTMLGAMGLEKIQTPAEGTEVMITDGGCRENGNFCLYLSFLLPQGEDTEVEATSGVLRWNRSDCFSDDLAAIEDTGDWKEWNYTTASGAQVLLIRSPSDWRGWIICRREEGVLSLQLEARSDLGYNDGEKSWWDYQYMTDWQMERVADAIDFGIQPKTVTQADVDSQSPASDNGYTVKLKDVRTDGYLAAVTLSVTAPEGTVLTHSPEEGEKNGCIIKPAGRFSHFLHPTAGSVDGWLDDWELVDDGDGLDHTQDIRYTQLVCMEDGSTPYAQGSVWDLELDNLAMYYWDDTRSASVEDILSEGTWSFPITFGRDDGDYREVELLSGPLASQAVVGFGLDGSDALEGVEITSLKLRENTLSIAFRCDESMEAAYGESIALSIDFTAYSDRANGRFGRLRVVMEDGREIEFWNGVHDKGSCVRTYQAMEPVDLDQAAYVELIDGTKLTVPGRE